jgi:hypothetical protein
MRLKQILILLPFLLVSCNKPPSKEGDSPDSPKKIAVRKPKVSAERMSQALAYAKAKNYNTRVAFLTDMSLRSGKKRFFVVNLDSFTILHSGLVTHGHCKKYMGKPGFSNVSGSNCTSLGRYKIGYKYDGRFGTAYKLHGLDTSNSNAFARFVVLHSHSCVPDMEQQFGICLSEGCPTVSPYFLSVLEPIIDGSNKPILLWVYN